MIEIRWHARGGQGAFTASKLFGETIALHENRYALAFPSFGPERRGAPVLAFTKIDDQKIRDRSEINLWKAPLWSTLAQCNPLKMLY